METNKSDVVEVLASNLTEDDLIECTLQETRRLLKAAKNCDVVERALRGTSMMPIVRNDAVGLELDFYQLVRDQPSEAAARELYSVTLSPWLSFFVRRLLEHAEGVVNNVTAAFKVAGRAETLEYDCGYTDYDELLDFIKATQQETETLCRKGGSADGIFEEDTSAANMQVTLSSGEAIGSLQQVLEILQLTDPDKQKLLWQRWRDKIRNSAKEELWSKIRSLRAAAHMLSEIVKKSWQSSGESH